MKASDALSAKRRQLPWLEVTSTYHLDGANGPVSFNECFETQKQLIVYHFMFSPDWQEGCDGCSWVVDNLAHPAHLEARNTKFILVSSASHEKLELFKQRMEWDLPWYSSYQSSFNRDFRGQINGRENHGFKHKDKIYLTYRTENRGVEPIGTTWSLLDLTPMGRQETWEDSPEWVPQTEPYVWWRHHDCYL